MPDSDDKQGNRSPDRSNKQENTQDKSDGLGLGNYQFFVHSVDSLDYKFELPNINTNFQFGGSTTLAIVKPSPAVSLVSTGGAPVAASQKQITDSNGAVITYPLWSILPNSVLYLDGSQAHFEYDTNGDVSRILRVPGFTYSRKEPASNSTADALQSELSSSHQSKDFRKWQQSDGNEFLGQITVLPDGNYQILFRSGDVHTFTTAGKRLVGRPFPNKFDIKQSLVRIYGSINHASDKLLTKEELNKGVTIHWTREDDAMLITMLKVHYEVIQLTREKAILKLGQGISMDDVLRYDQIMRRQSNPAPTDESLKTITAIFDLIDEDNDQNVSITEIKDKTAGKAKFGSHKLSADQKTTLNYLTAHTEKLHAFTTRGYVDRTERMTKNEFMAHYKDVYREQISSFIAASAWGLDKTWSKTLNADRRLFANEQNPLQSLKIEAIKQGRVGDCLFLAALASLITVRPQVILDCIKMNDNGTFTVTFPGARDIPIAVQAPTSAELSLYARGSEYGIWAPLMEKAYGLLMANRNKKPAVVPAENTATRENMKSLEILTGNSSSWEYTQDSCTRALGVCRRTLSENRLRLLLTACFKQHQAIIAASLEVNPPENGEPLIVGMHAYSVIGWDAQRDEVKIRNPWGVVPKNAGVLDLFRFSPGQLLEDDNSEGVFTMALSSFYKKFQALCVEMS